MRYLIFLVPFLAFGQNLVLSDSDVAAFYGAVGHGKAATGGRGQSVVFVTNLNDAGAGSLRSAVAGSNRYIVFTVGGTITLSTDLFISGDNITIAGETAPGDGIAVYGDETVVTGENIIIRHMRFRNGDASSTEDAFRLLGSSYTGTHSNYVFDHLSVSWGDDETFSIESGDANAVFISNVTLSNSMIYEGLNSKNMILYGGNQTSISIIRNIFAHSFERNIRSNQGSTGQRGNDPKQFEFIDNLIYGYVFGLAPEAGAELDVIGNVYLDGYATQSLQTIRYESGACNLCDITESAIYYTDNTWNGSAATVSSDVSTYSVGARQFSSGYNSVGSENVQGLVSGSAGARNGISGLDPADQAVINDIANGSTGSFAAGNQSAPSISGGTPYVDSDGDGLSDEYEVANGGGPGNWFVSPSTRPVTAQLVSGVTIDQTAVTAGIRYTHMDIFLGELAGDWTGGSSGGGGTNDPATDKGISGTSAMLIAH